MATLKETLQVNLKEAMKAGDTGKRDVLRMLTSAIKNKEIDKQIELNDEQVLDVLSSEAKKRKESILQFTTGGRPELAEKEQEELDVIKAYLPEQMSEEDLEKLVKETITELGATTITDLGKVMGQVMKKAKGTVDGTLVNNTVKRLLS